MSIVKRHLAEQEERLVLVEEICIDIGALVLDTANAYVAVFQAWAKGTIKGTAEQIFDATKSILED
jgi:Zn finger protein HypA/HybF involved in hydrogenase expression